MIAWPRFVSVFCIAILWGFSCACGGGNAATTQPSGSPHPTPSATPTPSPTPVPAPTPSPTPTPQAHSVSISWQASLSPDVVSYNVYRSLKSGGPYTKVAGIIGVSFNDTNVQPGATYFYVISAVNSSDVESVASSPEVNATVPK